jgi:hypothetical protein
VHHVLLKLSHNISETQKCYEQLLGIRLEHKHKHSDSSRVFKMAERTWKMTLTMDNSK